MLLRQFQIVFYYPERQKMILRWQSVLVLILLSISAHVDADQPDPIRLWNGAAPESLGDGKNDQPTIQRFRQQKKTKRGRQSSSFPAEPTATWRWVTKADRLLNG